MQKLMTGAAITVILCLFWKTEAFSESAMKLKGGGGWDPRSTYGQMYNPQTLETISGEVVSVEKITPMKSMSYGVHAMVNTDKETISVHLGPGWYIENQDLQIAPKDKIKVKGSRITYQGKPAIIAAEVTKGEHKLVLRDTSGIPVWSGWRSR